MWQEVAVLAPVVMKQFKIFGIMRKKVCSVATLDFKRADLKLLRELVGSIPWKLAPMGLGICDSGSLFKGHLLKA